MSALAGVKVQERFPLTEAGWAQAWQSLVQRDPVSAQTILRVLADRQGAGSPSADMQQLEADTVACLPPRLSASYCRSWAANQPPALGPRPRTVGYVGDSDIDPAPADGNASIQSSGGQQDRQEWVRANFAQIFGTSAEELQAQGINPRQYAREHRDKIRQFAEMQRSQGVAVPSGRASGSHRPGSSGSNAGGPDNRVYGYGGGGRFGMGMRGGTAWIGVLIALFALRFLLVDSFAGTHAAIFWVLGIGGIMLVARVFLFSWLRKRRFNRRQQNGH